MSSKWSRPHSLLRPSVLAHHCGGLGDTASMYCICLLIPSQMIIPKLSSALLLPTFIQENIYRFSCYALRRELPFLGPKESKLCVCVTVGCTNAREDIGVVAIV